MSPLLSGHPRRRGAPAAPLTALVAAAAVLAPSVTGAQPRPTPRAGGAPDSALADSTRAARLAAVRTTARRYEAPAAGLPQKLDVVTRADIERTAATDVVDVLKKTAAVDVVQYPTLLAGVGIRGFRPQTGGLQQRTLVLLDGRPAGVTNLALLDLGAVERIEVLKGPASALYGSSAMGGVVNVVTRRTSGRPTGTVSAAYGSFAQSELALRAGGTIAGRLDGDLAVRRWSQGDDYRMGRGNLFRDALGAEQARKLYPAGTRPDRDVADTLGDGRPRAASTFRTLGGQARLGAAIGGGVRVDVRGEAFRSDDALSPGDLYAEREVVRPDGARVRVNPQDARKDVARQGGEVALSGERGRHRPLARVFGAREDENNYSVPADTGFVSFASRTTTVGAQLQDVMRWGAQTLTFGLDATEARARTRRFARSAGAVAEIGTFSPNSAVGSVAGFAEGRVEALAGRLVATAGGRADRIALDLEATPFRPDVQAGSETFTVFNPSGGVQLALGRGARAHASAGRAFVAPNAFGRAGLAQSVAGGVARFTIGNPTLRPERSTTVDAGLAVERPRWGIDADVTWFRTRVRDRITSAPASFAAAGRPTLASGTPVAGVTTSVNAGVGAIDGVEARLGWDVGAATGARRSVRLFANATRILDATERTRAASIDAARFAGSRAFDPAQVFGAIVFGAEGTRPILNVATTTATGGVEYDDRRRFAARATARYVGRRTDLDFSDFSDVSDVEYPPFLVLDLVGGVRVGARSRVDLVVSNATDENYYEKRGYNLPGRAVQLRVTAGL